MQHTVKSSALLPLVFEVSGRKDSDARFSYSYTFGLESEYARTWDFESDIPLDFSKDFYGPDHERLASSFSSYRCEEAKRLRLESELPFTAKLEGDLTEVDSAIVKGKSTRHCCFVASLADLSKANAYCHLWCYRIEEWLPTPVQSAYNLLNYCCSALTRVAAAKQRLESCRQRFDGVAFRSLVSVPCLRMTLLNIAQIGDALFQAFGSDLERTKEKFGRSKKRSTLNLYAFWSHLDRAIKQAMHLGIQRIREQSEQIPEQDLEDFMFNFVKPEAELKYLSDDSTSRLLSFVEKALKRYHPLSTVIVDTLERIVSRPVIEKLKQHQAQLNTGQYGVLQGKSHSISNLATPSFTADSRRHFVEEKRNCFMTIKTTVSRLFSLGHSRYLLFNNKQAYLHSRKSATTVLVMQIEDRASVDQVLGFDAKTSTCYFLGRTGDHYYQPNMVIKVKIPRPGETYQGPTPHEVAVNNQAGLFPDFAFFGDSLVSIAIKNSNDDLKVWSLTQGSLSLQLTSKLADHCVCDESTQEFFKLKRTISTYVSSSTTMNHSHAMLSVNCRSQEIEKNFTIGINLTEKGRPLLVHTIDCKSFDSSFFKQHIRVRRTLGLLHLDKADRRVSLIIIQKDAFVKVLDEKFPSRLRHITSKKRISKASGFERMTYFRYDERFDRLNVWHSQVTKDGKLALKVTPFQIRL